MVTNSVILDFGSEKITVLIGSKGANNTLRVAGKAAVPYAGFMFGDWIDRKNLPGVIAKALNDAAKVAGARIDKVYVGVPGEACALVTKEVNTVFNRKRKLKETDVFELHSQGEEFDPEAYEVINIQPVYYTIDNERRVISPVGQVTARFGGVLSYFLADRAFTDYVKGVLLDMGVPEIEFVCSPLAEALLLIPDEKRDATAVLIDVGYLTSTVSVVRGDGMLSLVVLDGRGEHYRRSCHRARNSVFGSGGTQTQSRTYARSVGRRRVRSDYAGRSDGIFNQTRQRNRLAPRTQRCEHGK